MSFAPFLDAPFIIQFHAVCAILALCLGPVALFRRRRDRLHRMLGRVWVGAMALTALSAGLIFEIRLIGPFSPIHVLIPVTLVGLWQGVSYARQGRITEHSRQMRGMYFGAIGIAGLFTLLPGRLMSEMIAPDAPWVAFGLAALALGWGVWRGRAAGLAGVGTRV